MIEISISSELAGEHPRFMAECAGRGHRAEVFESGGEMHEPACGAQSDAGATRASSTGPAWPAPTSGRYA